MTLQLSVARRIACAALALIAALMLASALQAGTSAGADRGDTAVSAKKKCKPKKGKGTVGKKPKKCKKKKQKQEAAPPPVVQPPTPLPLTANEVINQIVLKADQYCAVDADCVDSGYYSLDLAGTIPDCESASTYTWSCYGWNDRDTTVGGDPEETCDFREVVSRVGINGITSQQDLGFGGGGGDPAGWLCGPFIP